jgi:phage-related protein
MGDILERLCEESEAIRSEAGYQLELVQGGDVPTDFRPMPDVGAGAIEIRIHGENEYRVFYVARFAEAVYGLHCFAKKTRATRQADIALGRQRYLAILERRRKPI